MQFTLAQKHARNPFNIRIGQDVHSTFYGLGILAAMDPARAITETDGEEEFEGFAECLTEVVPWPFAEDEIGIAFDQENLYGVRTLVCRRPLADGGGDTDEYYTAVPKTLPAGYTSVGRCQIGYAQVADYLAGTSASSGMSWNHRTPTGSLLDTSTDEGAARATWAPMNIGQTYLDISIGDAYSGSWEYYYPAGAGDFDDSIWVVAILALGHVGFRGGKLTFTILSGYAGEWPAAGSSEYQIIAVKVTDFWDPADADGTEAVVEVLETGTVSWSFSSVDDPPVVIEHTLGDMRPSEIGVPYNFYIRHPYDDTFAALQPAPIYGTSHQVQLSPRTDVPLPYFASQRNRVAPGGIVVPP